MSKKFGKGFSIDSFRKDARTDAREGKGIPSSAAAGGQ